MELISIHDRAEVEGRREDNVLALARLLDGAEGGILGFALATDDITSDAARFRGAGFNVIGPAPMERLRPDGRLLKLRLLVPEGGSWDRPLPFFIQWDAPDDERLSWEWPGNHANGAAAVLAFALTVVDLDAAVDLYESRLGLALVRREHIRELGAGRARFRVGHTWLDLLTPEGAGIVKDAVEAGSHGPWQLTLAVRDLAAARQLLAARGVTLLPAPGTPGGQLIAPSDALSARIVLVRALT